MSWLLKLDFTNNNRVCCVHEVAHMFANTLVHHGCSGKPGASITAGSVRCKTRWPCVTWLAPAALTTVP